MMLRTSVVGLVAACCLLACSKDKPSNIPNVEVICDVANDGKTVTVIGWLSPPALFFGCDQTCDVALAQTQAYTPDIITLKMPAGTGPMTLKPPPGNREWLGEGNFTIIDSDGERQWVGKRVRATGTLEAKLRDGRTRADCTLRPTSVRGIDPPAPPAQK